MILLGWEIGTGNRVEIPENGTIVLAWGLCLVWLFIIISLMECLLKFTVKQENSWWPTAAWIVGAIGILCPLLFIGFIEILGHLHLLDGLR
jgi:hypothetical protein